MNRKGETKMKKNLIKTICAMAAALILVAALASCGTPKTPKATFTVGFDSEFPPYGYVDEKGEYAGFDLDLAREVAKRNDWEIKLKPIDWDTKDFQLSSGAIDCIWNGFTINGRENDYTWSAPYVDNSQVIVAAVSSGITKLSDLAGKIVAVQTDSSAEAVLKDDENEEMKALAASFASIKDYGDYNTAFLALESGTVDAVAMDIGVAKYQIESRGNKYVILSEQLASEEYGIGFLLGNTELKDKVSKTVKEMMKDGTFQKTAEKYGLTDSIKIWD